MLLGIIVGHEESRPGVKGAFPLDCHEYHFNKNLAVDIYRFAREAGLDCRIFLRDGIGRAGVIKQVNEWTQKEYACAIELHLNAFDKKTKGTETLYTIQNPFNRVLADMVQLEVCRALNRPLTHKTNRGIKIINADDRGYYNMAGLNSPCCLTEPVFADNPEEARLMESRKTEYAKSLVKAALEFLVKSK